MSNNIVIFGPAHAGKSTLAGYLYFKHGNEEEARKTWAKINQEAWYVEANKFSYLVDTAKEERIRTQHEDRGTSKTVHIKRFSVNGQNVVIIDTPGAQHKYRERVKGISFGEIGIFVIELGKLSKIDYMKIDNFFSPLILWNKLKGKGRLLVAISKLDKPGSSEKAFNKAAEMIKEITNDETLDIIPIAILVKDEEGHNITSKSKMLHWYPGSTLMEKLDEFIEKLSEHYIPEPLFVFVDEQFRKPGIGNVYRGKVYQGSIRKGDTVKVTPAEYEDVVFPTVLGQVRNLQLEAGTSTEVAVKGDIIGVDIHEAQKDKRRIKEFNVTDTSCIIAPDAAIAHGNILQFEVSPEEIENFNLLDTLMVLWFGRFISTKIVHISELEGKATITLFLDSSRASKVSLPLDIDNNFLFRMFYLKLDNRFVCGQLTRIGNWRSARLLLEGTDDDQRIVEVFLRVYLQNNQIVYEIDSGIWRFKDPSNLIFVFEKLKEFFGFKLNKKFQTLIGRYPDFPSEYSDLRKFKKENLEALTPTPFKLFVDIEPSKITS